MSGMTRSQLWGELADVTPVESLLWECYESEEGDIWHQEENSPHGSPWHTSFHGSNFPGDNDSVCGRAQVYELMNPAPEKPLQPWLRAWFNLGNDIEHMHVRRLSHKGVLLSNDVTGKDDYQTVFQDPEVWLSGSPDAIVLPRFSRKAHVSEIKSTEFQKVINMQNDRSCTINSHGKYIRQLKTYIAEAHLKPFSPTVVVCKVSGTIIKGDKCNWRHTGECDPTLVKVEPPDDGTLIYCAREEPLKTVSYYVKLDLDFLKAGKEKIKVWKEYFENNEIPPHVHEGQSAKWSVGSCQYCGWKKSICKPDYTSKTTKLSESALIEHTKSIRQGYDPDKTRKSVLDRWSK